MLESLTTADGRTYTLHDLVSGPEFVRRMPAKMSGSLKTLKDSVRANEKFFMTICEARFLTPDHGFKAGG